MTEDAKNADEIAQAAEDASSTLEATLEAKMAAMQEGIENEESKVDDSKTDDSVVDESKVDDEKVDDSEKKDDEAPLLPSGHRRAALAKGYTAEEIDWFVENKPDEAKTEFKTLFDERQRENSEWSQRGRDLRAAGEQASKGEEKTEDKSSAALSHFDAEALATEHPGSEDLINALVGPLNATIDRVNATAERLSHSEEFLQNTEQEALAVQIKDFFGGKGMVPFKDTYGTDAKTLTDEQLKSRMELFEQADIISAGANDHGRDISVQDAMERAHILVSQGTRDEGIRAGIRKSMKKRTITTKSSHQSSSIAERDQPITEDELEKRTVARLAKIQNK